MDKADLVRKLPSPHVITSPGAGPSREDLMAHPFGRRYLRCWLANRLAVGVLGLLMPLLLILGDVLVMAGGPSTRGSLSAYYHSGMRDVFVGIMCIVGLFLVTYKVSNRDWDNGLTLVAGVAAVTVALFPTWRDRRGQPLTPWQDRLGEATTAHIHLTAAAVFTVGLALVSLRFGHRDGVRGHAAWARIHRACGVVMLAAVASLAVFKLVHVDDIVGWTVLLWVELVCTLAFGISWLLKGIELGRALRALDVADLASDRDDDARREAVPA